MALVLTLTSMLTPQAGEAQYFGRNKVAYDHFDFRVLETEHFDVYHYEAGAETAVRDISRMAERWYERLARTFQHDFEERKPLIIYRNTPVQSGAGGTGRRPNRHWTRTALVRGGNGGVSLECTGVLPLPLRHRARWIRGSLL